MITQAQLDVWKRWATDNGHLSLPRVEMLALIAALEEAREALKPFMVRHKEEDANLISDHTETQVYCTISDLRRAAKAGGVM